FARARDKENKELDTYKFYINSLYVAMTRAVRNLYVVEQATKHPLLQLLGLVKLKEQTSLKEAKSSLDDWKLEARKLELQGKKEQSDAVKQLIAKQEHKVVLTDEELAQLKTDALNPEHFNNQAKKKLFAYAISTSDHGILHQLEAHKFPDARKYFEKLDREFNLYAADCLADKIDAKNRYIVQHGVNFKNSFGANGLFPSVAGGALKSLKFLTEAGADRLARDNQSITPLQYAIMVYSAETMTQHFLKKKSDSFKPRFDVRFFGPVYNMLRTHTLAIEAENRFIRIGSHTMEYFLLNFVAGMINYIVDVKSDIARKQFEKLDTPWARETLAQELHSFQLGLSMDDIMQFIELIPNTILPDFRKKRTYVNSILSKNEVNGNDPYNRKLFKRMARGIYRVNPGLRLVSY
ncbi:MAG: hypothetical protein ABI378_13745, partial [Chitinophagaceae bacterium]